MLGDRTRHGNGDNADGGKRRRTGIVVVGVFAFIAGLGEVVVGFTGNYLGILAHNMAPSVSTGIVGIFYSLGGLSLLITRKRWGAVLGIVFIGAELLGRLYLIAVGIAPGRGTDAIKILVGGLIALALIIYVARQWKYFD